MNKIRIFSLIGGAVLVVGVILVALGFKAAPKAEGSSSVFTGFGDLRVYENQLALSNRGAQESYSSSVEVGENIRRSEARQSLLASKPKMNSNSFAGFGDLRLYEEKLALAARGEQAINRSSAGMGDLQRYEAQKALAGIGSQGSSAAYTGMGDLQRYEAQKALSGIGSQPGMGDLRRYRAKQHGK